MYVLDTNTLIYYFRGQGKVAEHLLNTPPAQVAIPAVTVYELAVGIAKSSQPAKRRKQFDQLLDSITILPLDRTAAVASAAVRAGLEKRGRPIGPMDTLIAGTALAHRPPWLRATPTSSNGFQIWNWQTGTSDLQW